jgi:GLPGLI family protein
MKIQLLFLFLLVFAANGFAQTSGTVIYKETAQLHINIQGDAPPPPNLPRERNAQMILYYTPEASLYMNDPSADNDGGLMVEDDGEGESVRVKMPPPDNRTYCDLKNEKRTDQRDFMQRKFLIETELKSADWKLTGNQKTVLNYPCQEAIRQEKDRKVVAWFTTSIPVSSGPSTFCGLPGLVLEVSINDGDQKLVATAVNATPPDPSLLVKPKDGKKVTEKEFEKIRDEKLKEMGIESGSGNNVIIRIENR